MQKPLKAVPYYDSTQLRLHVYVVGYPSQGESILMVISEGDRPLVVIVTDCYEISQNYNHVSQILIEDWNSAPLDVFVWTHPHEDHSKGIPAFLSLNDKGNAAHIVMPTNMAGLKKRKDMCNDAKTAEAHILKNYVKAPDTKCHYIDSDLYADNARSIKLKGSNDRPDINVVMSPLSPIGALAARTLNESQTKHNKGSIVYMLSVNGIDIFMGGDIDPVSVPYIDEDVFHHVNLIKIPHHGSRDTGNIHKKFGMNQCDEVYAATTMYDGQHDPKVEILTGYAANGTTVHCTGPDRLKENPKAASHAYGVVHYTYNINTARLLKVELIGNAYRYHLPLPYPIVVAN